MTRQKAEKLNINYEHVLKLERNVEDALKCVSAEMIKAPEGQFNSNQITVYMLSVMYMLMNKDVDREDSKQGLFSVSSDNSEIMNKYKDYLHYKKDYMKSKATNNREMMLDYHEEMIRHFKELLDMFEEKFREEMSSSDCEDIRSLLKHRIKAMYNEFNS